MPACLDVTQPGSARNAKGPRPKQLRSLQRLQFSVNQQQRLLQRIIRIGRPHEPRQIPTERRLNVTEQQFERLAVAALGAQDPQRYLIGLITHAFRLIKRLPTAKKVRSPSYFFARTDRFQIEITRRAEGGTIATLRTPYHEMVP